MKIEIDLNDILGDEFGTESLNEAIKRQVVESLTRTLKQSVLNQIDKEVNQQISTAVHEAVVVRMQDIIDDVLTAEYTPVDNYGNRRDKTTFKDALIKEITSQMVYKKGDNYNKNLFTKSVDGIIESQMKIISADFKQQCNTEIAKEAFNEAVKILRDKLL